MLARDVIVPVQKKWTSSIPFIGRNNENICCGVNIGSWMQWKSEICTIHGVCTSISTRVVIQLYSRHWTKIEDTDKFKFLKEREIKHLLLLVKGFLVLLASLFHWKMHKTRVNMKWKWWRVKGQIAIAVSNDIFICLAALEEHIPRVLQLLTLSFDLVVILNLWIAKFKSTTYIISSMSFIQGALKF